MIPSPPGVLPPPSGVGRGVAAGAWGVDTGVGRGVGARAWGGRVPTIALGWMLRSWFLLPDESSWSVRMCQGAPDTIAAPSEVPPPERSQYADWARWPPHDSRTADRVFVNVTRKSAALLPSGEPECTGPVMDVIVPP